jgi:hypothetical protein
MTLLLLLKESVKSRKTGLVEESPVQGAWHEEQTD